MGRANDSLADERERRWPLVVFPRSPAARSSDWAVAVRGCSERYLSRLGSMLFRGFEVLDGAAFRRFVAAFGATPLEPWGGSCLSRPECGVGASTSTFGSAVGAAGLLHQAHAHSARWPAKLWLQCPAVGGPEALQLVDGRDVWQRLPERVRRRFVERGLAYCYELRPEATTIVSDYEQLAARLRACGLSCDRTPVGGLSARQVGPAVLAHLASGELSWFNQAHLFLALRRDSAPGTLRWRDPAGRGWSASVCHADGRAIDPFMLAVVHDAVEQSGVVVPWEPGDVVLLDNEVTAHGWQAAAGQRAPATIMADARSFSP
ncbi:MAG: hypothetical protein RL685_537 [Pseudomonadota bacterium]